MNDSTTGMTRGALAAKARVHPETIRYYEKVSLLRHPARSAGGHRIYDGEALRRLRFIRRARELDFSISEIRDLLRLADDDRSMCAGVLNRTADHLADVRRRIARLREAEHVLTSMLEECTGDTGRECPIIAALNR